MLVILPGAAGCFHCCLPLVNLLFGAEAVIGMAGLDQLLRVGKIGILALGLDIGTAGAAHIGALIPVQAAGTEGIINDFGGAFHKALLVGILNAQNELAVILFGKKIGIEGGTNAAQVHEARGRRGKTSTNHRFFPPEKRMNNRR